MNAEEAKCITALKVEVGKQGERILALTKSVEGYHEDFRELFDERKKIGERVVAVEEWQKNFERNENHKLTVMGLIVGFFSIVSAGIVSVVITMALGG